MGFSFEIEDDVLLKVSGVAALGYGLGAITLPKTFNDTFMTKSVAYSEPTWRFFGHCCTSLGASHLCLTTSDAGKKTKKNGLKVMGVSWLTVAAMHAWNIKEKNQPVEIGSVNALGMTVLGSLCLWKGFSD